MNWLVRSVWFSRSNALWIKYHVRLFTHCASAMHRSEKTKIRACIKNKNLLDSLPEISFTRTISDIG